ncbi:hypothetical protein B0T25DRAFT_570990 [Lasiosphaeria hispida]|uniref:MHYT domain-containing protein n=1 Tax=Lasiosphaeria hispida TaxID=260671 RepID=A0AAJ0HA66_9PEZI|nr:hypothetical protein B0T25DRAFT_570990 [Lasiosphaeria hispida]
MGSPQDDLSQYLGQVVPFRFNPAILALSYAVSLVGAASTLELINRRTSRKGIYNNLLLLGSAISMGGVAIWCMHYIGNRATGLLHDEPELQIVYSVPITVASFFVPILVLLVAFYVVTATHVITWWRIGLSGTLSGGAICGMHYLGNASISNYQCFYAIPNVAGAAVIAAAASTIALALFFVFKASWTNSWWKRIGCAIVLAGAVSGMHWCAALGTSYRLLHLNSSSDYDSRNTTVIVVSCLSVAACLVMAIVAIYSARVRKGYASKAQRITLAAAVFDKQGKILVTPDGLLPSEEITSTFMQKTQHDVFSTAHPLFHWVFQASRNWLSVANLIDKMGDHLSELPHHGRNIRTGINLVDENGRIIEHYDTIFRELFCLAAACLADKMNEKLVDAGVLWDGMFSTGGGPTVSGDDDKSARSESLGPVDMAEKGLANAKRQAHGSLMFLVRKVEDSRAVEKLEAAGYRFAELHQVSHIIGSMMQIRTSRLEERLRSMADYPESTMLDPGVHVGLFAARPRTDQSGFDVLVRKRAHNLLPSVWMPLDRLEPSNATFLRNLDGLSLSTITQHLEHTDGLSQQDKRFAGLLREAVQDLRASLADPSFDESKFTSRITQVPCSSPPESTKPSTCSVLTFGLVAAVNHPIKTSKFEFIPLQLFKTQQLVYDNSPHRPAFARSVHRDIVPILNSVPAVSAKPPMSSSSRKHFVPLVDSHLRSPFHRLGRPRTSSTARHGRGASEHFVSTSRERMTSTPSNRSEMSIHLYNIGSGEPDSPSDQSESKSPYDEVAISADPYNPRKHLQHQSSYGGIMISSEVTVDVEEVHDVMPAAPAEVHKGSSYSRSNSRPAMARQMSQRRILEGESVRTSLDGGNIGAQGGASQMTASFEQAIELKDVSTVLGVGLSKVEVRKEGEATTFVDELFAHCIDTPRR